MRVSSNLLLSLVLSATVSFVFPMVLVGILLGCCLLASLFPSGIEILGNQSAEMILDFLAVFGNGKPFMGVITLGITSCTVGILFDLFNFYRYQGFGD